MNFGENLQNLRKQHNLSQEELADKMQLSRQSISKWESGSAYPEMDKVLALCNIFHCSLDELIQGNLKTTNSSLKHQYNQIINKFSRSLALAIGLILFGTVILIAASSYGAPYTNYGLVGFLLLVAIASPIIVLYGIKLADFKSKHPILDNFYSEAEVDNYNVTFAKLIAAGVAITLVGLVCFIALVSTNVFGTESPMPAAVFMLFVTFSTPLFVYAGIHKSKYDIKTYNHENSPKFQAESEKIGKICGSIMMIATIIFLRLGFIFHLWHICWITYPIAGILCGIVATILHHES